MSIAICIPFSIPRDIPQDFQDPRSCQDIQDEIKDLTKMSRQNVRSFQDSQEFKIFLRSWQDIQDVERWASMHDHFIPCLPRMIMFME